MSSGISWWSAQHLDESNLLLRAPSLQRSRMTWIKQSFLPRTHRCDWGMKPASALPVAPTLALQ
ncbi:DUF4291 family protein [Streptomyces chartreusis]|uniref:DUF4291 family protein n=1 Tax=Streptomyces chartreusis TaxID=1969 RepID=UPI0036919C8A